MDQTTNDVTWNTTSYTVTSIVELDSGAQYIRIVDPIPADKAYYVWTTIILSICGILAVMGNGIIVYVVFKRHLHKTVTHIFIVNLAIAHLLVSLLCTPIIAAQVYFRSAWKLGEVMCRLTMYLHAVFTSAAILTLSAIAIDRYYCVVYPLQKKITIFKGKLMVFYVWFHATIICLPSIFVNRVITSSDGKHYCREQWDTLLEARVYLGCYTTFTIICPLIVTSLAYCFVWRAFRSSQMKVNNMAVARKAKQTSYLPYTSKTEMRLLKMLFFMVFCFVTLWAPYVVHRFLTYMRHTQPQSDYLILTAYWICKVQPVLDPLIYGYLNKQFKTSLFDMCRICSFQCTCPSDFGDENFSSFVESYGSDASQNDIPASATPNTPNPKLENTPITSVTGQASNNSVPPVGHRRSKLEHNQQYQDTKKANKIIFKGNNIITDGHHQSEENGHIGDKAIRETSVHTFIQSQVYTISPSQMADRPSSSFDMFGTVDPDTIMEWKSVVPKSNNNQNRLLKRRLPYLHNRKTINSDRIQPLSASPLFSTTQAVKNSQQIPSKVKAIPFSMLYKSPQGCYLTKSTGEGTSSSHSTHIPNDFKSPSTPWAYIKQSTYQSEPLMLERLNKRNARAFLPPLEISEPKKSKRKRRKILHKRIHNQPEKKINDIG